MKQKAKPFVLEEATVESIHRDYSEALLLSLAYSFERAAKARKVPLSTPALK